MFRGLSRTTDRISQLAQRPDIATEVAQVRPDMAEADRTYAMGIYAFADDGLEPLPATPQRHSTIMV